MTQAGIYAIEHVQSGRRYIGSASYLARRWSQHKHLLKNQAHKNLKLQRAWSKYGEDAFIFVVLEVVSDHSLLVAREQSFIDTFDAVRCGFNLSAVAGRERAGTKHTAEAIARMSQSHKGVIISPQHREKLSAAFKDRKFSAETRAKISASKTGKKRAPFSAECRTRMSASRKRYFEGLRNG